MSLFGKFGFSTAQTYVAPNKHGKGVRDSKDLSRVLALPSRTNYKIDNELIESLRVATTRCKCASLNRTCCDVLRPIQGAALSEMREAGGLIGPIGVGHGKTLLDLLAPMAIKDCRRAVLLVPASLKRQLIDIDIPYYESHWKLPNIAGATRWFHGDRPTLYVLSYSELSGAKNTDILAGEIRPDLIIMDEAHSVKNRKAARTRRLIKYLREHPDVRVCAWSGTLTTRSLMDYAQLTQAALKDRAPVPLFWPVVEEWSAALDPVAPIEEGALEVFRRGAETLRSAFARRFTTTLGVVTSGDSTSCQASISINDISPPCPDSITKHLKVLEEQWVRPDGEELVCSLDKVRAAREISQGFFYRWKWIHRETPPQIKEWLRVRAEWHKELREALKHATTHLDSPLLLANAAHRWHHGYSYEDKFKVGTIEKHHKNGPRKTWASTWYIPWQTIKDTCKPSTEAVWFDDSIVQSAAQWLSANNGICWASHTAFGVRLAKLSGAPYFGAGDEAATKILLEKAERGIVASTKAHYQGRNLQAFSTSLAACPEGNGAVWEQLIGRMHRPNQKADEVTVDIFAHVPVLQAAMVRAFLLSKYIEGSMAAEQKLCSIADLNFPLKQWSITHGTPN